MDDMCHILEVIKAPIRERLRITQLVLETARISAACEPARIAVLEEVGRQC